MSDDQEFTSIAKIEHTMLGWEDHGILTAYLTVDYGGSGQALGGFFFDEPIRNEAGERKDRRGVAYGMEWIARAMKACGVGSWERIKGRTVLVYKEDDDWNAKVVGFGPLPTEPGEPFIFEELNQEFYPDEAIAP